MQNYKIPDVALKGKEVPSLFYRISGKVKNENQNGIKDFLAYRTDNLNTMALNQILEFH